MHHQLTHHGCRLSSHAPGRGGRNLQGTYRWATMNQQPLRGAEVCDSGLSDASRCHEWTGFLGIADCLESLGLHCLSPLSANPITQMASICNHHRTVISPQSPASSGITTVCLSSPFPSEHRRVAFAVSQGVMALEFGIRSPALRRQMPQSRSRAH